jgi:peptidoglycan/LPS O-acetylase OafA/YrhL
MFPGNSDVSTSVVIANSAETDLPVKPTEKHSIFFPNLDGLRFFSFLIVFLSHIFNTNREYIKDQTWYKVFKENWFMDGDLGVSFFFVLSGFLITYLLLKEKEYTGHINIKFFYVRRALRIWPLYFFSVFFGFVIFPLLKSYFGEVPNETSNPILSSLFLNNFDRIINGPPDSSVLSVLWSVAIEEQFYLVWPVLFILVPPRKYHYLFFAIVLLSIVFRAMNVNGGPLEIHTFGVISDMAIGGLGAYLCINSELFRSKMEDSHPLLNLVPYLAVILFIGFKFDIFSTPVLIVFKRIIITVFFIWIILEQNLCKRSYFKVSNLKVVSRLGKYTYGLYCLHNIACLVTLVILAKLGWDNYSWQLWLLQLPIALGLSIAMSYISYEYFEKWFLRLKDKFAYITQKGATVSGQ